MIIQDEDIEFFCNLIKNYRGFKLNQDDKNYYLICYIRIDNYQLKDKILKIIGYDFKTKHIKFSYKSNKITLKITHIPMYVCVTIFPTSVRNFLQDFQIEFEEVKDIIIDKLDTFNRIISIHEANIAAERNNMQKFIDFTDVPIEFL